MFIAVEAERRQVCGRQGGGCERIGEKGTGDTGNGMLIKMS